MEELLKYFPLVLYILGAVLLITLIVLCIKLIHTVDKTNKILDDAYNKTKSLNGIFNAIDSITDTLSSISDTLVNGVSSVIGKLFDKTKKIKKGKEDDDDE
jgi:uncharacterized protein YoxC